MSDEIKKPIWKKWWFWGIVIVILIAYAGSNGNKSTQTTAPGTSTPSASQPVAQQAPKEEAIKVSAVDLAAAYEANEVKADQIYKDKTADITGTVEDIGVSLGSTYIVLSAGKDFAITSTQCFFENKDEINKVAELKKGDKVTVEGVIDGKSLNVGVKNCILK